MMRSASFLPKKSAVNAVNRINAVLNKKSIRKETITKLKSSWKSDKASTAQKLLKEHGYFAKYAAAKTQLGLNLNIASRISPYHINEDTPPAPKAPMTKHY